MDDPRRHMRPFRDEDEAATAAVWHRAGLAAYPYLPTWQALTLEHARRVFHEVIRANCAIWVGTLDEQIVAYLAMNGSYLDRLYVDPGEWHRGWGTRFVALAKTLSPQGVELHTHQQNHAARALYEKHGFKAVRFGISPPPESAPDVEYHWRPSYSWSFRPALPFVGSHPESRGRSDHQYAFPVACAVRNQPEPV